MPTPRTIVAVHGVTVGGDADTAGYTRATNRAMIKFLTGMGSFTVPIIEARWADLSQRFASHEIMANAQATLLAAIHPGLLVVPKVLKWFGVPDLASVADLVADVFVYAGPLRTRIIRQHVRRQVLAARDSSGRGVVLHGNSLGSVVALDVVIEMLRLGEIGAGVPDGRWPVRALLTTGSPLGLDLPVIDGYVNRAAALAALLPRKLDAFRWTNLYDRHDPIVSGSIFGLSQGLTNLKRFDGYKRLGVVEATPESGLHLQAHTGYWGHPIVAQRLFQLANLTG